MLRGLQCRSGDFGEDGTMLQTVHTKITQSHDDDDDDDNNNKYYYFSGNTAEYCG
jgi:hypothetical protein